MGQKIFIVFVGLVIIIALSAGAFFLVKKVAPQSIDELPIVGKKTSLVLPTPTPIAEANLKTSAAPTPTPSAAPSPESSQVALVSPMVTSIPVPSPVAVLPTPSPSALPASSKGGVVSPSYRVSATRVVTASVPVVNFKVSYLTINSSPANYNGSCPVDVTFYATITTNGAGTVHYKFIRSDGSETSDAVISFDFPSSKSVSNTWNRGGGSGWEKLKTTSPNGMESSQATFNIGCN